MKQALWFYVALFMVSPLMGAVTVTFPNTNVQYEFVALSTTQWVSTLKPGLFPGDYKIAVSSRSSVVISSPIATATAVDRLLAYGVGRGLDIERQENIDLLYEAQGHEALAGTCGGFPLGILKSTGAVQAACMQTYMIGVTTINWRWQYLYDEDGKVIVP